MEVNTLISLVGMALGGIVSIVGIYNSMSIRIALLKQDISHLNEKSKEQQAKIQHIEDGMYKQIGEIHSILTEMKVTMEGLKN